MQVAGQAAPDVGRGAVARLHELEVAAAGAGPLATAAGVALLLVGAAACLARRLCVLTP
ncbi:hypothetical protein [Micrococcus porci]|uniref:hypothetical protein n=1 Tax=Micrococcus porci TaxID=2856555 RepID=UPI003CF9BEAD